MIEHEIHLECGRVNRRDGVAERRWMHRYSPLWRRRGLCTRNSHHTPTFLRGLPPFTHDAYTTTAAM